jgi:hypothetical protein
LNKFPDVHNCPPLHAANSSLQFFEASPGADLNSVRRLVCGGAAGITSVFFTYPLDIVRTRLSIQSASFAVLGQGQRARLPGMWATLVTMYKTEGGILALYRGIIPTVAGVAPYVSWILLYSWRTLLILSGHLGWLEFHDLRTCSKIPNP